VTTVFTNGCFDILHRGHVEYLEQAKQLGDWLVVGLNSDASVRRLKGDGRPFNCEEDRLVVLFALGCVDEVLIFDEDTPLRLIQTIKPDIVVKGGDYTPENVVSNGLPVVILPYIVNHSTTRTLHAINGNRTKRLGQ
jgi:D-beta-D-heptose 7-phosphate kinase/D-beta-D-heptose 1-phosphate adenosyltransferase